MDNWRECPILPRHRPRVFPDLVIGPKITERTTNRTERRRCSRQGLHLHVGLSCLPCPPWACALVYPIIGAQPLRCGHVLSALSPAFPSFFHLYKFISSPTELQSELDCQTSSFQEVSSPCQLASTLTKTSAKGIHCDEAAGNTIT